MPISPDRMKLYPGGSIRSPEWLAIRERIRARAGDCCEGCGVRNLAYGVRLDGEFTDLGLDRADAHNEYEYAKGLAGLMVDMSGGGDMSLIPPMIRIVCTVAHLDGALNSHHDANLRFWCQRCHNRHDAKSRRVNASITRHEKAGQLDLIGREG